MKYLISLLVVMLGCQFTLAQIKSEASVKIEVSIKKTLTDFKSAMDKQNAIILRALNAEAASFKKDAKDAILAIVASSFVVASVEVDAAASNYFKAVSRITAAITVSNSNIKNAVNPEKLASVVIPVIDDYKHKLEEPIALVRANVKEIIAASPKAQACLEKALKDVTALSAAANKNITASFSLAIKDFNTKAKIYKGYIKTNVTLLSRAVNSCIARRKQDLIFLCVDGLLLEEDKALSFITAMETDITQLYVEAALSLSIKSEDISTIISAKKKDILAKISACAPQITTLAPAIGVGVAMTIKA